MLLGDPEQATLRAGYSEVVRAAGHRRVHRHLRPESRQHVEPDAQRKHRARRAGRKLAGAAAPAGTPLPGAVPGNAHVPHSDSAEPRGQHQRLPSGHRSRIGAVVDGRPAACPHQRHGTRNALRRHPRRQSVVDAQLQRAQRHRERIPRRVQDGDGEPAREQSRPAGAAPDRSRTSGPARGTNPLPIYLAYLNGRRDADNPGAYTGGTQTWTNTTLAWRLVHTNPNPNFVSSATIQRDQRQRQCGWRPR